MKDVCCHVGLFTKSPKKLIEFYTEKLGFELGESKQISSDWMEQIFGLQADCQLTKLKFGDLIIEIFSPQRGELQDRKAPMVGFNHLGIGVEDKKSFVQYLEKKGMPVLILGKKGRFVYFIRDPEGNLIEIYESKV